MAKKKFFKSIVKVAKKAIKIVPKILPFTPARVMGLPSIAGKVLGFFGKNRGAVRSVAASVAGGAVASSVFGGGGGNRGYRRRRRGGLTMQEMGKIMVMGQALGKSSPAVTLMTMRAIGGKL